MVHFLIQDLNSLHKSIEALQFPDAKLATIEAHDTKFTAYECNQVGGNVTLKFTMIISPVLPLTLVRSSVIWSDPLLEISDVDMPAADMFFTAYQNPDLDSDGSNGVSRKVNFRLKRTSATSGLLQGILDPTVPSLDSANAKIDTCFTWITA
jgi:hypothetical protein